MTSIILVILYAAVPLMMMLDTRLVKTLVIKNQPALTGNDLEFAIGAVKTLTFTVHVILLGLLWLPSSIRGFFSE